MGAAFLQDRIDATKALILKYETAIDAVVSGGVESYTLDTGQSRQTVTKINLSTFETKYESALNRLATLEARRNAMGVLFGRGV